MRALVVEDEGEVADDIARALQADGFVVDVADDGEDAWFKGNTEDYAVAILDLGLPRIDGLSVLRRWRDDDRLFPVIIVSARNDWTEKVAGIEAGADDYLGKPFEIVELIARVRGLVRRAAGRASASIRIGNLVLDTHRMSASYAGRPIRLSQL
jgi:DNA-binding response OmpR family regulator